MASFDQQFLSTFLRRQPFDLPDSMIYYILKNPKSSKLYQKLIQCCKYFFIKNPILVLHCLEISDDDGWKTCSNQSNCGKWDFHQTIDNRILSNCKLWIDCQTRIISTNSNAASDLIPNIYQCDATRSFFVNQNFSFPQFLFYSQNAISFVLKNVIVNSDNGAEISLEEIITNLPNILKIFIKYHPDSKNASTDTVKNLFQIPHFNQITRFDVFNASEKFDIDPIYEYYKNNRSRFTFAVDYRSGLSEELSKKIDGIANEILDYQLYDNETPMVGYPEQDIEVNNNLVKLHEKSVSL